MILYSSWQGLYQAALVELQPEELRRRIQAAEAAIHQRVEHLKQSSASSGDELWAIEDALRCLQVLAKTEELGEHSPRASGHRRGMAL